MRDLGTRDWWTEAAEFHGQPPRPQGPPEVRVAIRCRKCLGYRRGNPFAYAVKSVPPSLRNKIDWDMFVDLADIAWWIAEVRTEAVHEYSSDVLAAVRRGELDLEQAPFRRIRRNQLVKYWTKAGESVSFSCTYHPKVYRPRSRIGTLIREADLAHRAGQSEILV